MNAYCKVQMTAYGASSYGHCCQIVKAGLPDITAVQLKHTIEVFSMEDEQSNLAIIQKLDLHHKQGGESASLLILPELRVWAPYVLQYCRK